MEEKQDLIYVIKDYFLIYTLAVKLEKEAAEKRDILFDEKGDMIDTYSQLMSQYRNLCGFVEDYISLHGPDQEIDSIKDLLKKVPENPWLF